MLRASRACAPRVAAAAPLLGRRGGATLRQGARLCTSAAEEATAAKAAQEKTAAFWGTLGALANWGLAGSAMYDAYFKGPEIISLNMTCVQIGYSCLFARWAWVVQPRNLLLCACHVTNVCAQSNQLRRCLDYKLATEEGAQGEISTLGTTAAVGVAGVAALILTGGRLQTAIVATAPAAVGAFFGAAAGPFTVHFWAPMSKWLISGASMADINRPTDRISLAQYTALTCTGAIFSRYALAVVPINYLLCSVNIALFGSSAILLGRKVKADYIDPEPP